MKRSFCFSIFTVFLLSYHIADGMTLETSLEEITQAAGKIVGCRCVEERKGLHPEYKNVKVTFVTFDVFEELKGRGGKNDPQITIMQYGHGIEMPDIPTYNAGEEMILFLYPESRYGFTSPVAGHQGKFGLKNNPDTGKRTVIRNLKNACIIKENKHEKQGISSVDGTAHSVKDDIKDYEDYDAFCKRVRTIINQGVNKEVEK